MVNFIYLHYDRNHNTNYELLGLEEDEWVKYNDQECLDKITGEFLNKIPKNFLNRPKYDAFLDLWVNVVKNVNCLLNSFQPLELTKIDFLVYYCDDNGLKDDYLQKLVFKNGTSSTSSINIFKDCKFSDVFGKTILKIKTKNKINLFKMSQSLLLQASLFSNVGYHYNILNPEENIRYVIYDLSNNQLEDFDSMKTMASEYSLVINLSSNKIKTIDSSTFDKFKALQILYLSYNQLKTLSLNLEKLPSLEELNLSNNKLTEIIFEEPSGSVLEILSLQNNKLTDAQNIWIQIQKLTKLKELYLDGNKLKRIPSEETINILKGLDFFHLYNNDFSESDVEKTPLIGNCSCLHTILC